MPRNSSPHPKLQRRKLCVALAACFASGAVLAAPTGAQVAAGSATFAQSGSNMTITNSNGTIINWQGFSIGSGESVRFVQSGASSSVLNRVITNTPSEIFGQLTSNGRVFLINPAGILVGKGAVIDVGSFVASTLQLSDADFLAGRFVFQATSGAGSVRNEGTITSAQGGSVYLVAPQVENSGIIKAPGGEVLLAAGKSVEIGDTATPGVRVEITGSGTEVSNLGSVFADAGRIGLVGALIKNSGTLSASSAVASGGRVFLRASGNIEQSASGRIEASGTSGGEISLQAGDMATVEGGIAATGSAGKGGRIEILGDKTGLFGRAEVDASGRSGGGTVLLGGDYQGVNPAVRNARYTYMSQDATIRADATDSGDGGKVIVWADDATRAYGRISARGGANDGDGGFVETSGKKYLDVGAIQVDRSAPKGKGGTWLLDPDNVTIDDTADVFGGGSYGSYPPGLAFQGATSNPTLNWSTIVSNLGSGPVIIATSPGATSGVGNLFFTGGKTYAYSCINDLWFVANKDIYGTNINLTNSGSGDLKFIAGWSGAALPANPWDYNAYNVTAGTGSVTFLGSTVSTGGSAYIKAGSDVIVKVNYPSGGSSAQLLTGGSLQIDTWGNLVVANEPLSAAPPGVAEINSAGNQNINLWGVNSSVTVSASAGNGGGSARIRAQGTQTIDFKGAGTHTLALSGGDSSTAAGAAARIEADGDQTILNSGSGTLDITLTGGTSSATGQDAWTGPNMTGTRMCVGCATFNEAQITSRGNQIIQASSISLYGGSGGVGNSAGIEADGTQNISVSGAIYLEGGSNGGLYIPGYSVDGMLGSSAHIGSETAQTISAGTLTLDGGSDSVGISGAYVTAPVINITTSGNLSMNGGTSSVAAGGLGSAAVIGYDQNTQITLNVGGDFSMQSGSGSEGGTYLGTLFGSGVITASAQSINIQGDPGANAFVGNANGLSNNNTISLVASGSGGIVLGPYSHLLAGNSGSVVLAGTGGGAFSVQQSATATRLVTRSLIVSGDSAISLDGPENNVHGYAYFNTSSGNISFTGNEWTTHIAQAVTGSGDIQLATIGANKNLALGNIATTAAGTVNIAPSGAILDDNGDGVANITAGTITLSSVNGNSGGGIAVSADVISSGSVSVTVPVGAGNGGIRIHSVGASAPSTLNLSDATTGGTGDIYFSHDGNLNANANYTINAASGSAMLTASGDLDMNGASISAPSGLLLNAGNNLAINSLASPGGSLLASAGNAVNFNTSFDNRGSGDTLLIAPNVNIYSGVLLKTDNAYVLASKFNLKGGILATSTTSIAADEVDIEGGTLTTTNGDLTLAVSGDVRMTGGLISAGNNLKFSFSGENSTLYINEFAAQPLAKVVSGSAAGSSGLIYIDYLARSEGGCVIDGVAGFITTAGGSGFYNASSPAVLGGGLLVTYVDNQLASAFINDLVAIKPPDDPGRNDGSGGSSTSLIPPPVFGDSASTTDNGGNSNEFGGGSASNQSGASNDGKAKNKQRRGGVCR